jgi:FkbM family methyltransferase
MGIADTARRAREAGEDAARKAAKARGLYIRRPPPVLIEQPDAHLTVEFEHLVARLLLERSDRFFVQIGAFDGRTGDQIHDYVKRFGWHGVLVEPQPRYFRALQETYAGFDGLDLRNVAVAERAQTRKLYAVREGATGLPDWAPQTASFDRSHIEQRGIDPAVIESYEVDCVPLSTLLEGVERVDLLQIDVEGFDAAVVAMFDFDTYRPQIVRFENAHLSRADHNAAVARLVSYGYRAALAGFDTIAWHD